MIYEEKNKNLNLFISIQTRWNTEV